MHGVSPLGSFLRIVSRAAGAWKGAAELLSNSGAMAFADSVQFTGHRHVSIAVL
jgi:hypothetical protein